MVTYGPDIGEMDRGVEVCSDDILHPPTFYDREFPHWLTAASVVATEFYRHSPEAIAGVPQQTADLAHRLALRLPSLPTYLKTEGDPRRPDSLKLIADGNQVIDSLPGRILLVEPAYPAGQITADTLLKDIVEAWRLGLEMRTRNIMRGQKPEGVELRIARLSTWMGAEDSVPRVEAFEYEQIRV